MKKRIAFLLCIIMMMGILSGCTLILGGLAIVWPYIKQSDKDPWAEYECITIAEALALCGEAGNVTTERYYIRGTVESVDNATYGAMTVKDETGTIFVYNSTDKNNVPYAEMSEKPYKDDQVLLYCILQNHNGTKEVKQAQIIDFIRHKVSADSADYPYYTLDEARKTEKGTKMQVEGVVARITYANGKIPSGVILADHTDSIYIYDGDLAARVSIGNYISVFAEKDYWILEDEKNNAEKFGYKGCNQLTNATLVSNDNGNAAFDTDWIETTTVKKIIDTPVNEDISTKIFKVTALVKKVPGSNFVNYYFFDLDGETGSYAYTQCNGSDFTWLDEFDGKICTVYLTALNAKSTASDCYWRLLPVKVMDEGFDSSAVNVPENAVKYYGVTQFLPKYTGNPELQLLTSVDNALLGYAGVTLSYTSSNPSVISIENGVMNCLETGTAVITVTATYNGTTYSEDVTIGVAIQEDNNTHMTVKEAIAAPVGEKITVKGIVGPSLVNKSGFYLIDETGAIAVLMDASVLKTVEIGYEVVLTADRTLNKSQDCLANATVTVNNYGSHDYSTNGFKGEISVAEFTKLTNTTEVYTMTATVEVTTGYSTNVYLSDGANKVQLYAGGGGQYKWIADMVGQEITVEIAACNWNGKGYKGCVLAVIHADGTKTVNTLNFN